MGVSQVMGDPQVTMGFNTHDDDLDDLGVPPRLSKPPNRWKTNTPRKIQMHLSQNEGYLIPSHGSTPHMYPLVI